MRKFFIIVSAARYALWVGMKIYEQVDSSLLDVATCSMNTYGYITTFLDVSSFVHSFTVFCYLACLLKQHHRAEYRLKRNGLWMYFSVLYLNFMVNKLDSTFTVLCGDEETAAKCAYARGICDRVGLLRGEASSVVLFIFGFTQLPQVIIGYIIIFKQDQSDCIQNISKLEGIINVSVFQIVTLKASRVSNKGARFHSSDEDSLEPAEGRLSSA